MLTGIDFSSFGFGEPLYLWLLVAPGILLLLWTWQVLRRRRDRRLYLRGRVLPVRKQFAWVGDLAFWFCLILAVSLCIVALARPQARVSVVRMGGTDFVILQDGSASMYVKDVPPDRWQRSVQFLRTFAETLTWKEDRVALALFAYRAAPQVRLTTDPNALFFFLEHLAERSPFRLEDDPTWGTNIEEGVRWGLEMVETDEELFGKTNNPKAFLVISDGQAWSGKVARALAEAVERDVLVYVVGVGTPAGGWIPEVTGPQAPTDSVPIRAILDRDSLREIANAGGGEYFEIGRQPDREVAARIIAGVRKRGAVSQVAETSEELYWQFLFAAALLLCLGTLAVRQKAELWWQAALVLAAVLILAGAIA